MKSLKVKTYARRWTKDGQKGSFSLSPFQNIFFKKLKKTYIMYTLTVDPSWTLGKTCTLRGEPQGNVYAVGFCVSTTGAGEKKLTVPSIDKTTTNATTKSPTKSNSGLLYRHRVYIFYKGSNIKPYSLLVLNIFIADYNTGICF